MRKNLVKQALQAGKVQLGTSYWQLRSPEVARILVAAGFQWAFIDTEHGGFDIQTIQDVCRVANMAGLCPIVRVADMQYHLVARALDCGAQGIIFPRVESPELLERAVSWCRFPPCGIRGYGLGPSQIDYEATSIAQVIDHMNREIMVVLQIETRRAVEARDELLSVNGVDTVMVGPVDLSISLGVPGDFQSAPMVEAMEQIRDSCIAHKVIPGTQTRTIELAKFWKDRGMLFLGCNNELSMMLERGRQITAALA